MKHKKWIQETFENNDVDFMSAQSAIGGVYMYALNVKDGKTIVRIDCNDDPYCGCHCFAAWDYDVAPEVILKDFKEFLTAKGIGLISDRETFDTKMAAYIEEAEAL